MKRDNYNTKLMIRKRILKHLSDHYDGLDLIEFHWIFTYKKKVATLL